MNIWCITDHIEHDVIKKLKEFPNVIIIGYDDVYSSEFDECRNTSPHKFEYAHGLYGRELLFLRSMERMFLCENLMRLENLEDVLFIELDNMLYMDPAILLDSFKKRELSYLYMRNGYACSGILFARDAMSLYNLNRFMLEYIKNPSGYLSEMVALYVYSRNNPSNVQFLPTHIQDEIYPIETHEHFSDFPCIFDPATIGVYLFGQDTIHTNYVLVKGKHHDWASIDYSKCEFEWHVDSENRKIPFIVFSNGSTRPIFNLHIHAKNLEEAES